MVFNAFFNNIYIVAVSFIGGGTRNTQKKPPTWHKSYGMYDICKHFNLSYWKIYWKITANRIVFVWRWHVFF